MTLACPSNKTIFISSAYYGQFSYVCGQSDVTCCPPHTGDDCTESLEENSLSDFLELKVLCDNQTTCEFMNEGGYVASCDSSSPVDYMTIYYQCLPGMSIRKRWREIRTELIFTLFHVYFRAGRRRMTWQG